MELSHTSDQSNHLSSSLISTISVNDSSIIEGIKSSVANIVSGV
ncbi:MAG: hypothetical protein ACI8XB_002811 [Patiriisocius sp.]|jgi:hypothetical protein